LPSARGQGEPLSGRLDPPDGATFAAVLIGESSDRWLLACDAGHGFIAKLEDLYARNRGGKSVFNLPESARVLPASPVTGNEALVCAVNSEGRLLVFPAGDLPQMERGRGNLIFGVPGRKAKSGEELTLLTRELADYRGERGQRGALLPRGWRKVDRLEVEEA
jgi:topoisomerase-4 subunit A